MDITNPNTLKIAFAITGIVFIVGFALGCYTGIRFARRKSKKQDVESKRTSSRNNGQPTITSNETQVLPSNRRGRSKSGHRNNQYPSRPKNCAIQKTQPPAQEQSTS